jgi:hypothetical protein
MKKNSKGNIVFDPTQVPLESSLGHLAYGDLAFKAWRKLKIESRQKTTDEEE